MNSTLLHCLFEFRIYKKQQSLNHIVKALLFSINNLKESNYSAP